ncbi:MAG: BspA family leucine-rich repeat surface protein [Ruminococcaceae bacterium]|nr:BspA family leucine-rich repeat surface protein [Oscillospiraceae bacterium]
MSSRTAQTEQPHNFMIIANAIFYNGTQPDKVYLGANLVWEKETTPPTPTYGNKTFAGKFTDSSTESYWKFWPNGQTGNGTSIKDYVDPETKEFNFDYNTPLTSCRYLFNGNSSYGRFERIDHIPDTSGVTNMNMMFANNASLKSVNLSDLDTSKVTDMSNMFNNCNALDSLDVSGFDTSNVSYMNYMFQYCTSLTTLDLSGWDVSEVMMMAFIFDDCKKLTTLNLSGWDFSKVRNAAYMLGGCSSLTTVLGPISGFSIDNFSVYSPLTADSAMVFINGLAEVSETKTITFSAFTYDQLTPEQIAIATSKGWNVVRP